MHNGYLSEESKKKFSIITGILGAVFFVGQFIIPFIFMIPLMMYMFSAMENITNYDLSSAVPYDSGIFVKCTTADKKYSVAEITPEKVTPLFNCDVYPWLVNYENQVWCFNENIIRRYQGGQWIIISNKINWGKTVNVDAIDDGIVVETRFPDSTNIFYTFYNNTWIVSPALSQNKRTYDKIVQFNDKIYTFKRNDLELYCREGLTNEWIKLGKVGFSKWHPIVFKSELMVIQFADNNSYIFKMFDNKWEKNKCPGLPKFSSESYVFASSNNINIITSLMPGSLSWYSFDGEKAKREKILKKGLFPFGMMKFMFVPHIINICVPLLLAFILTILIRKYRNPEYSNEKNHALYAPLIRRAFAEMIDIIIVLLPLIIVFIFAGKNIMDIENMGIKPTVLPFIFIGVFISTCGFGIIMLFVYSFLEGKYCATPGKWLLGIRVVGIDLKPCGFGRAFLRNILRFVDGFFNYLVGILIIAFTDNQQRIGDMAARTIVIKKQEK